MKRAAPDETVEVKETTEIQTILLDLPDDVLNIILRLITAPTFTTHDLTYQKFYHHSALALAIKNQLENPEYLIKKKLAPCVYSCKKLNNLFKEKLSILKDDYQIIPLAETLRNALLANNVLLHTIVNRFKKGILHYAAHDGWADAIRVVLLATDNSQKLLLKRSCYNCTPLHCAAWSGNMDVVQLFLIAADKRAGELLMIKSIDGETARMCALQNDYGELARYLQLAENAYGPDKNIEDLQKFLDSDWIEEEEHQ
jgi:hypothetical protein